MFELHSHSDPAWITTVLQDFDAFLIDHAACERKASSTAMQFVVRYTDREGLIGPMIDIAIEELEHFQQVYKLIQERNIALIPDTKDIYVNLLMKHVRGGRDERLMDRLIVGGVLEARGCERFGIVAEALPTGSLKEFYEELTRSEARHHGTFLRMARLYFTEEEVHDRHQYFLDREAEALAAIPLRPALH